MMTTGEIRGELAKELGHSLAQIVNQKKHLDEFYIMVVVRWEGEDVLRTKLVPMLEEDIPKHPMFNTILYYINNRNETFEQKWCLPMDPEIPERALVLLESEEVEAVLRSSANLTKAIHGKRIAIH